MKKITMMLAVYLFTAQLMAQTKNTVQPPPPPIHKSSKKTQLPHPPLPPVVKAPERPAPPPPPPIVTAPERPTPPPPPLPPTNYRTSKKIKHKNDNIHFTPPKIVKEKEI